VHEDDNTDNFPAALTLLHSVRRATSRRGLVEAMSHKELRILAAAEKRARQESLFYWSLQFVDHPQPVKPFKKGPVICEFSV